MFQLLLLLRNADERVNGGGEGDPDEGREPSIWMSIVFLRIEVYLGRGHDHREHKFANAPNQV